MMHFHAAALALVGCALIFPPYDPQTDALDTNRPVNEWYVVTEFETCAKCESRELQTLESLEYRAIANDERAHNDEKSQAIISSRNLARCYPFPRK